MGQRTSSAMRGRKRRKPAVTAPPARRDTTDRLLHPGLSLTLAAIPLLLYTGASNPNSIKTLFFSLSVAAMAALWLGAGLLAGELSWPRSRLHAAILVVMGWALLSAAWSPFRYASLSEFLRIASYALFYLLVVSHVRDTRRARGLVAATMIGAGLACAYGLLQHFGIDWIEWTPKEDRILSSFANPTFFAGYLVLLIPLALMAFLLPRQDGRRWPKTAEGLLAIAMLQCLVWTYTRAAHWGLVLGLALAAAILPNPEPGRTARHIWRRAVLLAAILMILVLPRIHLRPTYQQQRVATTFSTKDQSNVQRLMMWHGALSIFREHPVWGSGLGTFQFLIPRHISPQFYQTGNTGMVEHAHNEPAEVGAEQGAIGLAAFLALLGCFAVNAIALLRRPNAFWQFVAVGSLAGVIAFQVQNLAAVTMHRTACVAYFWFSLALVTAGNRAAMAEAGQEPPVTRLRFRLQRRAVAAVVAALVGGVLLTGFCSGRVFFSEIALKQGDRAVQAGDWRSAESSLRRAIGLNRYCLGAYYKLGHVLNVTRRYALALSTYRDLERMAPDYARIHFNLGVVLSNLGRMRDALWEHRKAVALEDSPANHSALAEVYLELGEPTKALAQARAALDRDPGNAALATRLAWLQFHAGHPEQAKVTLREAIRANPKAPELRFALGNLYLTTKDLPRAASELARAAALNPHDVRIQNNLGNAYQALGRYREAIAAYRCALALHPDDLNATFNLAVANLGVANLREAQSGLRRVIALAPGSVSRRAIMTHLEA